MTIVVTKKPGESEDRLIARFKKRTFDAGIVDEARKRKEYVPKSQLRKEKKYRLAFLHKLARRRAKSM
jgi:ribosomal protein S21